MLGLIVTAGIAADIATWCFKVGAQRERAKQNEIISSTRTKLSSERNRQKGIEWETRQRIQEELNAAHQAHYEMLSDMWVKIKEMHQRTTAVLQQFKEIQKQNRISLQSLALTPDQRVAITESNDQLERGIQRLYAYRGTYLQHFRGEVKIAQLALKSHNYITPDLPNAALPDDFPFGGELLEFDHDELRDYPFVDLGHGQRGRFITPSLQSSSLKTPLPGLIQRYDREAGFWILSAARGALAMELASGAAYRLPRNFILGDRHKDCRLAWWEHESGECLEIRMQPGGLSPRMRRAPWGTPIRAHIHSCDFFLRNILGGEGVSREHRYSNWLLPCDASAEFWEAYDVAAEFSDRILIRETGMDGDPKDATFVLRLATGREFPVRLYRSARFMTVLPQCGWRLGVVKQADHNLLVFLLRGELHRDDATEFSTVDRLIDTIEESFNEQKNLIRLDEQDSLELKKYRAVLKAEVETARERKRETVEFLSWVKPATQQTGQYIVMFRVQGRLSAGRAVCLLGEDQFFGWSQGASEEGDELEVAVLPEKRKSFADEGFPHQGTLEALPVDRELLNKINALENFSSAATAETLSLEEQAAFTKLRWELLGQFSENEETSTRNDQVVASSELDEHQERAVILLSGTSPLVLIQGPPGTGKTHVIAHAINRILTDNPKARIAITSQANPAVDEAVAKIQSSSPSLQIYRDYSASAKEKYAALDRHVGVEQYLSNFITDMEAVYTNDDPYSNDIRDWLKESVTANTVEFTHDIHKVLSQRSQIVACTLSRLAAISASAPLFDLVIVDEAAKASMPEAMIAANCAKRLALVGDHRQLLPYLDDSYYEHSAPTLNDRELLQDLWNDSLFSKLWRIAPESRKAFLAIMRRSRRPIAECISTCFYEKALHPARDHYSSSVKYPMSLVWVESTRTKHRQAGQTTIENPGEVKHVLEALEQISRLRSAPISIAVIAFHRGQAELLAKEIKKNPTDLSPSVLTVDASQGGQWDVVILSLARTHGSAGFVGNPNRMNVAISRAKEICIIVGRKEFAIRSNADGSCLSDIWTFINSQPKKGKWICNAGINEIREGFGFPSPVSRPQ